MAANSFRDSAEREGFWREQVLAWRAEVEQADRAGRSPITVREFCRSRGLREPSFYFWRRELAKRKPTFAPVATRREVPPARGGAKAARIVFAPVTVKPAPAAAVPIEIEVGGVTLRVQPDFDEAALARLIAVLRA